jgi:hypothetical protein
VRLANQKTPEQLEREIAYFASIIHRSTSQDRIQRAHRAIALRKKKLAEALRMQPPDGRASDRHERPLPKH